MPRRLQIKSFRVRVALVTLVALVVFAYAFEWTWLRPLIQNYVLERSGRRVDFDELHVGLNRSLEPTFRLRRVLVQNAPWAAARPFVAAAELEFSLAWESFYGERVIVSRLVLVDADLDLERQADGLRNWRLTRPEDRGPGRLKILSVDAQRTRAHILHRGLDLELDVQSQPLGSPQHLAARDDLPMTRRLGLRGTRGGTGFQGQFTASDVLTFADTGRSFALRGTVQTARSQLSVEGVTRDLVTLAGLDVDLHATGSHLADFAALLGSTAEVPALPLNAQAHVNKDGKLWTVSHLQAQWGDSDLSGTLDFRERDDAAARSTLRASLTSRRLDLSEWRLRAPGTAHPPPAERLAARLPRLDAEFDLTVGQMEGLASGRIGTLHARALLGAGRLRIEPLDFAVAGGRAAGSLMLDTASSPNDVAVDMRFSGLHLDQLTPRHPGVKPVEGGLDLRVAMHSQGGSLAAIAAAASGSVKAELVHATIPVAVDAKLGLDGGAWLRSLFRPGERAEITCSELEFHFDAGKGRARRFSFETDRVAMTGTGWVDLPSESFDVLLTPHRKQLALLALDKSVQVSGSLSKARMSLVAASVTPRASGCVSGMAH